MAGAWTIQAPGKQLTFSPNPKQTDMKTSGQDADTAPDRECSTCGVKLLPGEYDLCETCRSRLYTDDGGEQWQKPPSEDEWR